jgi:glycosyltransferase involved in cell wall biosynthesis
MPALDLFPELKECEIISTKNFPEPKDVFSLLPGNVKNGFRYRFWKRSWKGPADSSFLLYYPVLTSALKRKKYDFVILENLSTLNAVPAIRKLSKGSLIIYDAHNVDSRLIEIPLNGKENPANADIEKVESTLYRQVDALIACSDIDLQLFKKMNEGRLKGAVVPNGVELRPALPTLSNENYHQLIFCGSLDYEPNREGLLWFCTKVLPDLVKKDPSIRLIVIGKGEPGVELKNVLSASCISYHGRVKNVDDYYQQAIVAIVPLFTGSGTRLKVLEAMSRNVPVISTTKGAEGIEYDAETDILIADEAELFAKKISDLIANKERAREVAINGYQLVKTYYDWNVIGRNLADVFNSNFN